MEREIYQEPNRATARPTSRQGHATSQPSEKASAAPIEQEPQPTIETQRTWIPSLTRRQFLQVLVATSAALVAEHYLGVKPVSANETTHEQNLSQPKIEQVPPNTDKQPQLNQTKPSQQQSEISKEPSLTDTAIESALFTLAKIVSTPIVKGLKIPVGNAGFDQKKLKEFMEKPFYQSLLLVGGAVPLIEEAIFRALPQLIVRNGSKDSVWEIGVPVSAIFALVHNFKTDEATGKSVFATDKIPLYQFIGGLFFWKMMREKGFPHAVLAHSTVNSSVLTVGKILYEAFPNKFQKDASKEIISK